ncbi:MAG: HU family DNA-binding protein [Anaerofustis stercorihominis]|nr:HU family DNA-binding protein [Anaerofustis stercorihominis]
MNKAELIAAISKKTDMSRKDVEKIVTSMLDTVTETLKNGDRVSLVGFGTFEAKQRASREGINPRTKERIVIPATKSPTFKAGKVLKEEVNEK